MLLSTLLCRGEILEVLDYSARAARRCGLSKNACFSRDLAVSLLFCARGGRDANKFENRTRIAVDTAENEFPQGISKDNYENVNIYDPLSP